MYICSHVKDNDNNNCALHEYESDFSKIKFLISIFVRHIGNFIN